MGILIGPTPWWQQNVITVSPVGTTLPDGSRIICKAGGTAWIVAPANTQVTQTWNGTVDTLVGTKCCVCDWSTLNTQLINCGFNPADWFVPTYTQLQNPGYVCRTQWDTFSLMRYWSSTELNATFACMLCFNGNFGGTCQKNNCSDNTFFVRAFRCVTY
jgi:hypothetical protein